MKILISLFLSFLKIGSFTFGGGLAMLPLIRHDAVVKNSWLNEDEIVDCFAISQSLPGIISVNAAIYIGYKVKGFWGALAATLGVILPAFVSIILILVFLKNFENNPYINGAFEGVKASALALILITAMQMGKTLLKSKIQWAIFIFSFIIIVIFKLSAVWPIILAGCLGYFYLGKGINPSIKKKVDLE
jgi:chromate transporter